MEGFRKIYGERKILEIMDQKLNQTALKIFDYKYRNHDPIQIKNALEEIK